MPISVSSTAVARLYVALPSARSSTKSSIAAGTRTSPRAASGTTTSRRGARNAIAPRPALIGAVAVADPLRGAGGEQALDVLGVERPALGLPVRPERPALVRALVEAQAEPLRVLPDRALVAALGALRSVSSMRSTNVPPAHQAREVGDGSSALPRCSTPSATGRSTP